VSGGVGSCIGASLLPVHPPAHVPDGQERIAGALGGEVSAVSVKASTPEGLGTLRREEGIGAWAVALVRGVSSGSRP